MPENNLIGWIIQQTGLAGVAALALYMLNAVWKKYCEDMRGLWEQTCKSLDRNTEVLTLLSERLDSDQRERQDGGTKRK